MFFLLFSFGAFVFESSCVLGVSLVCFVLLGFLGPIFAMFLLMNFWCSLFRTFVFETSCMFGVSLVCFVLLGFLGSIFAMFLLMNFGFLFFGFLFLRLRAF